MTPDDTTARPLDEIVPLVEREIREIAQRLLARDRQRNAFVPTEIVDEAFDRLKNQRRDQFTRKHLLSLSVTVIRNILTDEARRARTQKRDAVHVPLTDSIPVEDRADPVDLLALDEALTALRSHDVEAADIVQYRFFGGLSIDDVAAQMEMNRGAVNRRWKKAKAWLKDHMEGKREG